LTSKVTFDISTIIVITGRRAQMSESYPWADIYVKTLCETDQEKLAQLVPQAETALFLRELEIPTSGDHSEEHYEIAVAKAALLSIKVHKLGWPAPYLRIPERDSKTA
jgi:hypothetical protein